MVAMTETNPNQESILPAARLVGSKRAPTDSLREEELSSYLRVRIPLLPIRGLTEG
jgi:hypothetical protein